MIDFNDFMLCLEYGLVNTPCGISLLVLSGTNFFHELTLPLIFGNILVKMPPLFPCSVTLVSSVFVFTTSVGLTSPSVLDTLPASMSKLHRQLVPQ